MPKLRVYKRQVSEPVKTSETISPSVAGADFVTGETIGNAVSEVGKFALEYQEKLNKAELISQREDITNSLNQELSSLTEKMQNPTQEFIAENPEFDINKPEGYKSFIENKINDYTNTLKEKYDKYDEDEIQNTVNRIISRAKINANTIANRQQVQNFENSIQNSLLMKERAGDVEGALDLLKQGQSVGLLTDKTEEEVKENIAYYGFTEDMPDLAENAMQNREAKLQFDSQIEKRIEQIEKKQWINETNKNKAVNHLYRLQNGVERQIKINYKKNAIQYEKLIQNDKTDEITEQRINQDFLNNQISESRYRYLQRVIEESTAEQTEATENKDFYIKTLRDLRATGDYRFSSMSVEEDKLIDPVIAENLMFDSVNDIRDYDPVDDDGFELADNYLGKLQTIKNYAIVENKRSLQNKTTAQIKRITKMLDNYDKIFADKPKGEKYTASDFNPKIPELARTELAGKFNDLLSNDVENFPVDFEVLEKTSLGFIPTGTTEVLSSDFNKMQYFKDVRHALVAELSKPSNYQKLTGDDKDIINLFEEGSIGIYFDRLLDFGTAEDYLRR